MKSALPILALLALLAGGGYHLARRGLESTDDAQLDADIVSVPARIGGVIAQLHFVENQRVEAGALLAEIDDALPRARLAQAQARLDAAQAELEAAEAEAEITDTNARGNQSIAAAGLKEASAGAATFTDQIVASESAVQAAELRFAEAKRNRDQDAQLFARGTSTRDQLDQSDNALKLMQADLDAARARLSTLRTSSSQAKSHVLEASAKLEQTRNVPALTRQASARVLSARAKLEAAKAEHDIAALDLSYTKVRAPRAGLLSKKSINLGQSVSVGQTIAQLVAPELWVTANFKETQIEAMHVGQPVEVHIDALPHATLHGEIESFAGATGARFTLLPPDNASGNFVKVVQRIPVRVHLRDRAPGMVPGMSVALTVDTRRGG